MSNKIKNLKQQTASTKLLYVKEANQKNISPLLEKLFTEIFTVSNKKEALKEFMTHEIHLVILHMAPKRADTFELIQELRNLQTDIFIIVLSEKNETDTLLQCLELNIDGYLFAPFTFEALCHEVNKVVQKQQFEFKKYQHYANQYLNLFDKTNMISKTDLEGNITYINNIFSKISGYTPEEVIGKNHNILKYEGTPIELYEDLWRTIKIKKQPWKGLVTNKSKFNKAYCVETVITPLKNIRGEIIDFIAMRDSLDTSFDDKKYLMDRIEQNEFSILVMMQIDEFDMLDKFYNTVTVNQVEKNFAYNLLSYLPKNYNFDNIYSLGDGKFALLTDFKSFENSQLNIEEYLSEFVDNVKSSTLRFDELEFDLNISVSYAIGQYMLYEDAKAGLEEAMNKKSQLNFSNDLSISVSQEAKSNLNMIKTVKIALEKYNIVSYFQPILNNQTQEIEKYESLVRLIDEEGTIISPFEFLHISKKGNYYNKITERVLENSFKILHKINTELSINISVTDIEKTFTREKIFDLLEEYHSDAHRIVFELLEDEDVKDFNIIKDFIRHVKNQGVKIAIDDFGSGYSNFERLLEFEPDILKIDGSLIKNIVQDTYSKSIVETIVLFAKKQNIKTIAEYVENEEIFNILKDLGVDYSQGYYFGKPEAL
ncbi:MAG: EAL domain-containing protein [Candidatus Marinarcus sp.]|uniref:EAL domain-containing response regulator n=1 Tax=Candidatus Marinarcus sp. TaxID=3100987 RepID=UPI003B00167D